MLGVSSRCWINSSCTSPELASAIVRCMSSLALLFVPEAVQRQFFGDVPGPDAANLDPVAHRLVNVAHHEPHLPQRTEKSAHFASSLFLLITRRPSSQPSPRQRGEGVEGAGRSQHDNPTASFSSALGQKEAWVVADGRLERIERRLDLVEA